MKGIKKLLPVIPITITLYGHWNLCNVFSLSLFSLIFNIRYLFIFLIATIGAALTIKIKRKATWVNCIVTGTLFSLVFIGFLGIGQKIFMLLLAFCIILIVYMNRSEIKNKAISIKNHLVYRR